MKKGIPHWKAKFDYLCRHQGGWCAISKSEATKKAPGGDFVRLFALRSGLYAEPTELHHAGIHNTEVNRKLYPLLIHSLMNLMAVNHHFHMKFDYYGRISYLEADRREAFLRRHPKIANCANNPDQWMANL